MRQSLVNLTGAETEQERDVLAGVTAEEIKTVFDKVAREMFEGLQVSNTSPNQAEQNIFLLNNLHRWMNDFY